MNHSLTRINYNRMSSWYDWFATNEKIFTEIGLQILDVQPRQKVLEIGFGTGQGLITLAQAVGDTGKVYGIDISDEMILIAEKKIKRARLVNQIELKLGDAINLPFKEGFFEAIFMSFTLELFNMIEIPLVLAECKRVLSEDGKLGVVALKRKDCRAVRIYEWVHTRFPILVDCHPIQVRELIEEAGFSTIEAREKAMWGLPVEMIVARKYG
jgi:ubiquinone/menaquinone biosynthesis C-methylase UbiE